MKGNGVSEEAGQGWQAELGGRDSEKTLLKQMAEAWGMLGPSLGLFYREVVGPPVAEKQPGIFHGKKLMQRSRRLESSLE